MLRPVRIILIVFLLAAADFGVRKFWNERTLILALTVNRFKKSLA